MCFFWEEGWNVWNFLRKGREVNKALEEILQQVQDERGEERFFHRNTTKYMKPDRLFILSPYYALRATKGILRFLQPISR